MLRRAADLIEEHGFDLSALVSLEVGKNRLEAMGDVTETADLVRYYCEQMESNDGFDRPMAPLLATRGDALGPATLRGLGRHQPVQLPGRARGRAGRRRPRGGEHGRCSSPATRRRSSASRSTRSSARRACPTGAMNIVFGTGEVAGEALATHPGVDGLLFTGSKAVGMSILRRFSRD